MSPAGFLAFAVGVFAMRLIGGFTLGSLIGGSERWSRLLALLPLSIVAAVIAVQTFTTRQDVVFDARAVGVGIAAVAAWRRLPLALVVLLAAVSTALVRQTGWG
jgi:hypothetical protein